MNMWKNAHYRSLLERCQPNLQWDITSHRSEWPSSKNLPTINAGEDVEKREPSCTAGGNVNWYSHYDKQYGDSLKTWNKTAIWTSNPTSGHIPWESHNSERYMYLSDFFFVALFTIARTWKQKMSIDRWMDKEAVVHIYNGILLSHKKEMNLSQF